MSQVESMLGESGLFAAKMKGFRYRPMQLEMAKLVEKALANREKAIVEAGTGTGKTYAYLAPSLLIDKKIIISTGTKTLQDQLFTRDLPRALNVMGVYKNIALLKGRNNYICAYRLSLLQADSDTLSQAQLEQLDEIQSWLFRTKTGDLSEVAELSEQSAIRGAITSTADNCLSHDCPQYKDCAVVQARKKAQEADILVINHHVLLADIALKESDFGELLPSEAYFILDEAHQFEETASQFFASSFSSFQLQYLTRDLKTEVELHLNHDHKLTSLSEKLQRSLDEWVQAFHSFREDKGSWDSVQEKVAAPFLEVVEAYSEYGEYALTTYSDQAEKEKSKSFAGLRSCLNRIEKISDQLALFRQGNDPDRVFWYEKNRKNTILHATPINVAKELKRYWDQVAESVIFTSATLSVQQDFSHFASQVGVEHYYQLQLDSPFNYKKQGVFYVPQGLPEPTDPIYTRRLVEKVIPIIEAGQGRAFFLFTSYRAMHQAYEYLKNQLDLPLLMQGDESKSRLIDDFIRSGNGVLLGTSSFWEGIDIKGDLLSIVIIDKLPFASPQDPIVKAKMESIEKQGEKPFFVYQLPKAVIALKQGAGRLIRDEADIGLFIVGDPRLLSKGYGRQFVESLPNFSRTRDYDKVLKFVENKLAK